MAAAILALFLANSEFAETYLHTIHTPAFVGIGSWGINMSLHHWVNDGLMALFLFVVGLELKREIMVGELSDIRQAALPIFAVVNAGIPIQLGTLGDTMTDPVMLGVMLELLFGKFIGITGACWLANRFGVAQLPTARRFSQIAAVSVLGGIGFTMSIFIAELGFPGHPEYLLMAKRAY
ncbi:MAG: Na+/H+ antiporter NhaA [Methylophilus sp.]|nr:Na+/H+ antiporter NhaA [Methylophilus sp.]